MDDLFADTLWIHLFRVMLVSYYLLRVSKASSRAPFLIALLICVLYNGLERADPWR